jgi:DNA-directed RNA polymerase subunit F
MITDHAIDEALIEIMRTKKALEALRKARKGQVYCLRYSCVKYRHLVEQSHGTKCSECAERLYKAGTEVKEHAAAKRASMDLTRSLAKLRAGK